MSVEVEMLKGMSISDNVALTIAGCWLLSSGIGSGVTGLGGGCDAAGELVGFGVSSIGSVIGGVCCLVPGAGAGGRAGIAAASFRSVLPNPSTPLSVSLFTFCSIGVGS